MASGHLQRSAFCSLQTSFLNNPISCFSLFWSQAFIRQISLCQESLPRFIFDQEYYTGHQD